MCDGSWRVLSFKKIKQMNHSFNIEVAKKYGVEYAIILENMSWWIAKNKANKKHFYEGRYWTYNSAKAFSELFPYWSVHQIGRFLRDLETKGLIVSGNFNKAGYDKTKWYSVNDTIILQICNIECVKLHNPSCENAQPIPDINTDINTYNKTNAIDFDALLVFFNKTTGKNLRLINPKTKSQFNARIKEGYTKEDIMNAIKNCSIDKYHIENPKYLTPEFISRPDKIEKYAYATTKKSTLPTDWYGRELTTEQQQLLSPEQLKKWRDNKVRIGVEGGYLKPIER
jgi:uncharacterized phage protein (TIGR02220 family)